MSVGPRRTKTDCTFSAPQLLPQQAGQLPRRRVLAVPHRSALAALLGGPHDQAHRQVQVLPQAHQREGESRLRLIVSFLSGLARELTIGAGVALLGETMYQLHQLAGRARGAYDSVSRSAHVDFSIISWLGVSSFFIFIIFCGCAGRTCMTGRGAWHVFLPRRLFASIPGIYANRICPHISCFFTLAVGHL